MGVIQIANFQILRILKRGYGTLIALITFSFYFTYYPRILAKLWPYIYGQLPEIPLFVLILAFVNIVILLLYTLAMYFIYTNKWAFLQQYRISKEPWPWQTNYEQWINLLKKASKSIVINSIFVGPILVTLDCLNSFQVKMRLQEAPQSNFTYLWQFMFFLVLEQIWNYLMHRLLHHPKLYWIHKPHHQHTVAVSLAGQHLHPIQYIISSSLSTGLGYKILINFYPVHIFSLIIWMTFRVIETNDSHAGYNWPWIQSGLVPGNSGQNYHYYHHRVNVGNFAGVMYFMDSIFGTNKDFWKYEQNLKEKGLLQSKKILYGKQK